MLFYFAVLYIACVRFVCVGA